MIPGKFLVSLAVAIAIAGVVPSARADMDYSFSFGTNATGTFTTGGTSPIDPGFFFVTAFRVDSFNDVNLGPVAVSIDATMPGQFAPDAAYDPTTNSFVNHFGGGTFVNLGDIGNTGQGESPAGSINGEAAYVLGTSFGSGSTALVIQGLGPVGTLYTANGILVVTPREVPEPSSLVLFGFGIVGLNTLRRYRRNRHDAARPRPDGPSV